MLTCKSRQTIPCYEFHISRHYINIHLSFLIFSFVTVNEHPNETDTHSDGSASDPNQSVIMEELKTTPGVITSSHVIDQVATKERNHETQYFTSHKPDIAKKASLPCDKVKKTVTDAASLFGRYQNIPPEAQLFPPEKLFEHFPNWRPNRQSNPQSSATNYPPMVAPPNMQSRGEPQAQSPNRSPGANSPDRPSDCNVVESDLDVISNGRPG